MEKFLEMIRGLQVLIRNSISLIWGNYLVVRMIEVGRNMRLIIFTVRPDGAEIFILTQGNPAEGGGGSKTLNPTSATLTEYTY